MEIKPAAPGKFWAYAAIVVGGLLLLGGLISTFAYLNLSLFGGRELFSRQLGQIAALYLGLVGGGLALFHGLGAVRGWPSQRLQLPPWYAFVLSFALVLTFGNLLLTAAVAELFLFPPLFVLGAALPTLAVLAWTGRSLGWPLSWRQTALIFFAGSTFSVALALVLETILPYVAALLIQPLAALVLEVTGSFSRGSADMLELLIFSPVGLLFLIGTILQAPLPEEFAKVLGLGCFGRRRIQNERQAFMLGMAAGAGFAILENMLYQGLYAQWNGWSWSGVTLLRGIGSVLHPLCTGLVALGWFRARDGGWRHLLLAYAAAVGLHTLWNGGFFAFVFITGLGYYGETIGAISLYGYWADALEVLLIVFLVALSAGLWWLLRRITFGLAADQIAEPMVDAGLTPSPRTLAAWALACVLIIVPIGAALGPAWSEITALLR